MLSRFLSFLEGSAITLHLLLIIISQQQTFVLCQTLFWVLYSSLLTLKIIPCGRCCCYSYIVNTAAKAWRVSQLTENWSKVTMTVDMEKNFPWFCPSTYVIKVICDKSFTLSIISSSFITGRLFGNLIHHTLTPHVSLKYFFAQITRNVFEYEKLTNIQSKIKITC